MNKQELIEKYEKLEGVCTDPGAEIARLIFLEDLRELDEPQKVTIPQVAADWIEWTKKDGLDLQDAMNLIAGEQNEKLLRWFYHESKQETFARAWLDGYTIEKEPKYTVKFKATKQYLCNDDLGPHFDPSFRTNFTKSDLEKLDLGWVFDCEGMEVEKV